MYKGNSQFMQHQSDARNPFNFAHGDEIMTDDQKRDVLKTKIAAIDKRLSELPANHPTRKQLGREKAVVQAQLSELKVFKDTNGIERFFITAAKEILSQGQYNLVLAEAMKMLRRYKEIEYGVTPSKVSEMPKEMKQDLEEAVKGFIAKGGSITKLPSNNRKGGLPDPELSLLTSEQRRIYQKLRSCGICKEDALKEAKKP
ncbi:hypothetical protein OJF2_51450 [Aquisphaera giovannonii]|uniref:Uncharacterized protein n=1 Tax=Aquisphaera giovannonii TaxID=406548 RepID=A0A5B9W946_9BACT|nr:hypothetical protein [Aquisphaera giovannonii]QEH36561.1 hypothetical protein OJF2_51450 [Aquisphaera giovannonii]